jgi:hypothetical protein
LFSQPPLLAVDPSYLSWYLACALGMRCPRFGTHSQVRTVRSPKEYQQAYKNNDQMCAVFLITTLLSEINLQKFM